jgi:hypothetical protein
MVSQKPYLFFFESPFRTSSEAALKLCLSTFPSYRSRIFKRPSAINPFVPHLLSHDLFPTFEENRMIGFLNLSSSKSDSCKFYFPAEFLWVVYSSSIYQDRLFHVPDEVFRFQLRELFPFCHENTAISTFQTVNNT